MLRELRLLFLFVAALCMAACDVGSLETGSDPGEPPSDTGDDGTGDGDGDGDPTPGDPPGVACDGCHGSDGIAAPPTDLDGNSDRNLPTVGAHREHLAASDWRAAIACASCHVVPTALDSPGHLDGDNVAELTFDELNPEATYDNVDATCSNLYCHGDGQGQNGALGWAGDQTLDCQSCHGAGNRQGLGDGHNEHLGEGIDCVDCHADVVDGNLGIVGAALHVDGLNQVTMPSGGTYDPQNGNCTNLACHGNERW